MPHAVSVTYVRLASSVASGSATVTAAYAAPKVSDYSVSYVASTSTLLTSGPIAVSASYALFGVSAVPAYISVAVLEHPAFINSVTVSDLFDSVADYIRGFDEPLTTAELVDLSVGFIRAPADSATMSENFFAELGRALSDSVTKSDTVVKSFGKVSVDAVATAETRVIAVGKVATDTGTTSETIAKAIGATKTDTGTTSETIAKAIGAAKTDTGTTSETVAKAVSTTKTDTVAKADTVIKTIGVNKTDTGTTSETRVVSFTKVVVDTSTVSEVVVLNFSGIVPYNVPINSDNSVINSYKI